MVRLAASIHRDFHAAVHDASDLIGQCGGWMVSHQFYSDVMAVLSFECPGEALPSFARALVQAGFVLHQPVPEAAGQ
jgi:hypothetical protein